ncbi:MAG: membrane protein [Rhodothermaceae bacterium]|nr:MAG: membrane protein [Rhodothermaceae bacterium]
MIPDGNPPPSPRAVTLHPLDPAVITVWRIKLGLTAAVVVAAVLGYELFHLFDEVRRFPFGLLSALVTVAGLLLTLALPRLRHRYWRYALDEEALYLERGLFNRVRTLVPLRRIQHLDVSQDLIEREFDLARLIVHTAGSRSSEVVLPGLRFEEAEHLREAIKRYIMEEDVV